MKNLKNIICIGALLCGIHAVYADDTQQVNIKAGKHVKKVSYNYYNISEGNPLSINIKNNDSDNLTIKITASIDTVTDQHTNHNFLGLYNSEFLGNVVTNNTQPYYDLPMYYYFEGNLTVDGNNISELIAFARCDDDSVNYANPMYWGKSYKWKFGSSIYYGDNTTIYSVTVHDQNHTQYCIHSAGGDNNDTLIVDEGSC